MSQPTQPQPLANSRDEKFCLLMATGEFAAWEAFSKVRPDCAENTWRTEGPKLLRNPHIDERIRIIKMGAASHVSMTLEEWRAWHENAMRTPVGQLDENSPYAQEVSYEIRGGKRGRLKKGAAPEGNEEDEEEVTVKKVKTVNKQESSKQLAQHHGWLKTEQAQVTVTGLGELLAAIVKPGIPQEPT